MAAINHGLSSDLTIMGDIFVSDCDENSPAPLTIVVEFRLGSYGFE